EVRAAGGTGPRLGGHATNGGPADQGPVLGIGALAPAVASDQLARGIRRHLEAGGEDSYRDRVVVEIANDLRRLELHDAGALDGVAQALGPVRVDPVLEVLEEGVRDEGSHRPQILRRPTG